MYALSHNGLNFTPALGNIFQNNICNGKFVSGNPTVFRLVNGTYRIYVDAQSPSAGGQQSQQICTATSTDGLHFTDPTVITAPSDPLFNNNTGFTSVPTARLLPNGTILMYYIYNGALFPAPGCQTHYKAATSTDGTHFTLLGCVSFLSGYKNFVDPTFAMLPDNTIMFMAGTFAQQFSPQGTQLGIYRAYSIGSLVNFSALQLVIKAPTPINPNWTSGVTDPEVISLSNGTYRIYYDGATDNGKAMAVYSASWTPIIMQGQVSNVTATIPVNTSTIPVNYTSTITPNNYNASNTNPVVAPKSGFNYELLLGIVVVISVVIVGIYIYYRRKQK